MAVTMIDGQAVDLDKCEPYVGPHIEIPFEVVVERAGDIRRVVVKRYKTPREIYNEIHAKLDVMECQQCGHEWLYKPVKRRSRYESKCPKCKASDFMELIDEYDSCCHFGEDEDTPIADRDWHVTAIMVWCEPGSSEGDCVQVTVSLVKGRERKMVDVYRIKSFRGLEHCHNVVWRIMGLFGLR